MISLMCDGEVVEYIFNDVIESQLLYTFEQGHILDNAFLFSVPTDRPQREIPDGVQPSFSGVTIYKLPAPQSSILPKAEQQPDPKAPKNRRQENKQRLFPTDTPLRNQITEK